MNKIAQRRGFFNKMREKVNAPGEALSGVFSPEFTRLMDTLREVDDEAREHAADLKDMLKVARSNYNRREYMSCISNLGKFHERLELVRWQFSKLATEADMIHNEFLFGDLDEEHKKNLFEKMPERHKPKAKQKKEAGPRDWWHNLTSDRGRALKYWEKRFPRAAKEIKRQTEKMLNRSDVFLNILMSTFKTLATLRATRKLEEYIKVSGGLVTKYNAYDASFNEYFNGSVKPFIESQKKFEAMKAERDAETKEQSERPLNKPADNEEIPGESGPDSGDRPTGEFTKVPVDGPKSNGPGSGSSNPVDLDAEEMSEVEKALKDEVDAPISGWPKKPQNSTNPLTARTPETQRDSVFEPSNSEVLSDVDPSTPRPPSGKRRLLPPALPAGSDPVTAPQEPLSADVDTTNWNRSNPDRSIIEVDHDAAPNTPTMHSAVAPPVSPRGTIISPVAPQANAPVSGPAPSSNVYDEVMQGKLPQNRAPSLSDLNKPPTDSQLGRFIYYTPPEAAKPLQTTVRPGMGGKPPAPVLELSPDTLAPDTSPQTKAYPPASSKASEFVDKLTKLSDQNPLVLAREIILYAKSIASTDKNTSERLLKVAQQLIKQ